MMKKFISAIWILFLTVISLFSQEKKEFITLTGYVTSMQSVVFDSLSGPFINDNLIHNRLNFKGFINDHLTFAAEFRNRLFIGDMVRSSIGYAEMTAADAGLIDMSWNIVSQPSFFLNTAIDRLWFDMNYRKFQARIGRQRINWGQALIWNPNDIFNAYSFFDFDYVERPGSDAVRLQFYTSVTSSAELVIKADNENKITTAGLYRFNKWGYDIQFLAGYMNNEDIVAGTGWSGSTGSVSFRGEGSLFSSINGASQGKSEVLVTAGLDKVFKNNSIAQIQLMYASSPLKIENFNNIYAGNLSPKNLAFSKFSAFGQFTWAATPLLNLGLSAIWFPDLKGYFAGPSMDYSVAENLDISLIWQHFDSVIAGEDTRINLAFLRVKYSF